jgi:hypothetical protein
VLQPVHSNTGTSSVLIDDIMSSHRTGHGPTEAAPFEDQPSLERHELPVAACIVPKPDSECPWAVSGLELEDHRSVSRHADAVDLPRTVGGKWLEQYQIIRLSRPGPGLHDMSVEFDADWFAKLPAAVGAATFLIQVRIRTPFGRVVTRQTPARQEDRDGKGKDRGESISNRSRAIHVRPRCTVHHLCCISPQEARLCNQGYTKGNLQQTTLPNWWLGSIMIPSRAL